MLAVSAVFICAGWAAVMLFPTFFIRIFNDSPPAGDGLVDPAGLPGYLLPHVRSKAIQQVFVSVGRAKSAVSWPACGRVILLIPLIYILPNFFEDKVFAVFLAEPVSTSCPLSPPRRSPLHHAQGPPGQGRKEARKKGGCLMKTAIITGASSGLGTEFVRQLKAQFPDIDSYWLIARRADRLQALADALPDIQVKPISLDLTRRRRPGDVPGPCWSGRRPQVRC